MRPLVALFAGSVVALVAVDCLAGGPPGPPLGQVTGRLLAEGPLGVAELVAVAVVVQPGGGVAPGPAAPAGLGHLSEEAGQPGWWVELQARLVARVRQPSSATTAV